MTTKPLEITKLSQAIREGAKLRPQCRFSLYEELSSGEFRSCSLGAAAEAIGFSVNNSSVYSDNGLLLLQERFKLDLRTLVDCPVGKNDRQSLEDMIADLNDWEEWSREDIADWVEKLGY